MGDSRGSEDERRLATGWGRKVPKHVEHDWTKGAPADSSATEDLEAQREADVDEAADAGAISGRAATRDQQDLATGDTLGGPGDHAER